MYLPTCHKDMRWCLPGRHIFKGAPHLRFFTKEGGQVLSFVDYRRFGSWTINGDWGSGWQFNRLFVGPRIGPSFVHSVKLRRTYVQSAQIAILGAQNNWLQFRPEIFNVYLLNFHPRPRSRHHRGVQGVPTQRPRAPGWQFKRLRQILGPVFGPFFGPIFRPLFGTL